MTRESIMIVVFMVFLAGASAQGEDEGTVAVEAGAGAVYNAALDRYEVAPDATVTVNMVADFVVEAMDIGAITVDNTGGLANQGVAAAGQLNLKLTYRIPSDPGLLKDGTESNIVIFQIAGGVNLDDPATPDIDESAPAESGEILYSFQIQAGAAGTTITVDDLFGPPPVNPYGGYPLLTTLTSGGTSNVYDLVPLTLYVVAEEPADSDGDGVPDDQDNCPDIANADQTNGDGDGAGDACDGCPDDAAKIDAGVCGCGVADDDSDGDGVEDCLDNCPDDINPDQADSDGNGIGDACEAVDQCACKGDMNDDGQIDLEDLQMVANMLLQAGSPFIVQCD